MSRIKVFISGPYTIVDPVYNTRTAVELWHRLRECGFAPFCPHINMLAHFIKPVEYEDMMEYCFEYLRICDCLIRIPGMSEGSDREVELATQLNLPIFYSTENLLHYYKHNDPKWSDSLFSILHECKDQAIRGSNEPVEDTLDLIKKEIYYTESSERDQLIKIAAHTISALSRLE